MLARSLAIGSALLGGLVCVCLIDRVPGQDAPPAEPPPVPQGVEVQARGPVHEAFASLTGDPVPTKPVTKQPPAPLAEMPPDEKPEGDHQWIGGYWAWDDERADYLWVSGIWRTPPPGKKWVPGYWRDQGEGSWQWVAGFWTVAEAAKPTQQVTYYPEPPRPPEVAPPGKPAAEDVFYVPGNYVWNDGRYLWRAGYWARVQPGYVWVPAHFRWTPGGYVFIPGYWDLAVAQRGVLYAPVVITPGVVGVGFVYTPTYVVSDTVFVETLFVRPAYHHYYFGDYYAPAYRGMGFEFGFVYSQRRYDSIIVYESWHRRADPNWVNIQINLYHDRFAGRVACPPRVFVRGDRRLITSRELARERGMRTMAVAHAERVQMREHAQMVHQAAVQRHVAERSLPPHTGQPRTAAVPVSAGHGAPAAAAAHATPAHSAPVNHAANPAFSHPGMAPMQHPGAAPPGPAHPGMTPPGMAHPGTVPPPGGHPPGKTPPKTPPKHPPER